MRPCDYCGKPKTAIVKAFMTHAATPFVTEVRSDGSTRKVARRQYLDPAQEMEELKKKYGQAWNGIQRVRPTGQKIGRRNKGKGG